MVLIYAFWICLGFALDLSDADLHLLETDKDSFPVNILLVCKTSGMRPQDKS